MLTRTRLEPGASEIHRQALLIFLIFLDIADQLISSGIRDCYAFLFDVAFLNHELSLMNAPYAVEELCEVVDSLALARKKHPRKLNDLDALAKRYEISESKRQVHAAMNDVELLAEIYLHLTYEEKTLLFENGRAIQAEDSLVYDQPSVGQQCGVVAATEKSSTYNEYLR